MKLKLDENLGERGADLFKGAGHDVATVSQQQLTSASDLELITVCRLEGRCLVTLDLDFSNPLRFPPRDYSGIAVLRLPSRTARQSGIHRRSPSNRGRQAAGDRHGPRKGDRV